MRPAVELVILVVVFVGFGLQRAVASLALETAPVVKVALDAESLHQEHLGAALLAHFLPSASPTAAATLLGLVFPQGLAGSTSRERLQ